MAKKVKFLRTFGDFRKHKEYVVAEKVAVHFIDNQIAELIENIAKPCEDCEDCEDCKGKNKKTPKESVIKTVKKKKAPIKK